jgi:hypothetical protein
MGCVYRWLARGLLKQGGYCWETQTMKKLSNDLKRILSGLACQNAGEFQTMDEKMAVLGYGQSVQRASSASSRPLPLQPPARRIALISDGRGQGAPLDFAIDAAHRQQAVVDLLVHGVQDQKSIVALDQRLRDAGVNGRWVALGVQAVEGIVAYIDSHSSLIYLVAMPDDAPVKQLVEQVLPRCGGCLSIPLVLVEDCDSLGIDSRSAT